MKRDLIMSAIFAFLAGALAGQATINGEALMLLPVLSLLVLSVTGFVITIKKIDRGDRW